MANFNSAFPSKYLKASDLGTNQPIVTISEVKMEPVGQNKEMKFVAYFQGKDKGIVLNKTNGKRISQIAGTDETDEWPGTRICLFATETEYQGETVECIRVKAAKATNGSKPKPATIEPVDDDEIPFVWFLAALALPFLGLVSA